MEKGFLKGMLALHIIAAKETFGPDAIVILNGGELGVYENNPTVIEYENKGYRLCDANMFGEGLEKMETLTFLKVNKS